MPDDGRDVVGPLVISHKDAGPVGREVLGILESEICSQKVQASKQKEIEDVHTFFVGFIAPQLQGDPLNRVKHQQSEKKEEIKNHGKWICE